MRHGFALGLIVVGALRLSGCAASVESDVSGDLAATPSALGVTAFADVFQDHMVLQRDMVIPVWGTGIEGKKVSVVFQGKWYVTYVRDEKWKVWLNPAPAGGPYDLKLISNDGADRVTLGDIMVGDVYIASGQSNMSYLLVNASTGPADMSSANYPNIRHYTLKGTGQNESYNVWKAASPTTVGSWYAVPFYFSREIHKRQNVPVGVLELGKDGSAIRSWISAQALVEAGWPADGGDQWASKIAPVATFAIRGVLWYQGEGSLGPSSGHEALLKLLIQSWREEWNGLNIPFLMVQLPVHAPDPPGSALPDPLGTHWAYTRQAQMNVYKDTAVGNTHLAVTIDSGDCGNIHPPANKELIGLRLAQGAKKLIYGSTVYYQGPIVRSVTRDTSLNTVLLSYDFADQGMVATSADGKSVSNFRVRGSTGDYQAPTSATLRSDGRVELKASFTIRYASYAFTNCPVVDLVNGVGYPALPFQEITVP